MKLNFKKINGRRLAKATGITLAIAFVITTIVMLGKYAPGVLYAICTGITIAFFYFLLTMIEE